MRRRTGRSSPPLGATRPWPWSEVLELQAHCAARGLPEAGDKAMLVQRLAATAHDVHFRKHSKEMKLTWGPKRGVLTQTQVPSDGCKHRRQYR